MIKPLQQLFRDFLLECEFVRKSRFETLRGYKQAFSIFIKLIPDASLESFTPSTISNFFKILQERKRIVGKGIIKVGVKKSTIAAYWTKLNSFATWLKMRNHISINPFSEMVHPSPVYEDKKFLKKEEIEKILTAIFNYSNKNLFIHKRNLLIFYVLLFCGLRREELILLQVRDIDLQRKILTVRGDTSKSGRTRHLPIHSQIMVYLKDYLAERKKLATPYLIASSTRDDKLSYDGLKHLVATLNLQSGIKFHLHQFRHTFAVNFLKESNNIAKLKQLMGHTDIRMTMAYLRCLPTKEMRGDIEAMSIDKLI